MKRNAVILFALLAATSSGAAATDNSFCINHVAKNFQERDGVLISWEAPSGRIGSELAGVKLADKQFPAIDQVKNAVADVVCSIEAVGVNAFLNKRFERTLFDEEPAWLLGNSNVVRKNSYVTEIVETTEAERQRRPAMVSLIRGNSLPGAENLKPDEYGFRNVKSVALTMKPIQAPKLTWIGMEMVMRACPISLTFRLLCSRSGMEGTFADQRYRATPI